MDKSSVSDGTVKNEFDLFGEVSSDFVLEIFGLINVFIAS